MHDHQKEPGLVERLQNSANLLTLLCRTLAITLEVFLHRDFGSRYIGWQAAAALPLLLLYCVLWPEHDLRPMLAFAGLFVLACAGARSGIRQRKRNGESRHSYYNGAPRLARWFPNQDELSIKRREPTLVMLAGLVTCVFSPPLGVYLMLAAIALGIWLDLMVRHEETQAQDLYDAYVHQQRLAERFRALANEDRDT